MIAAAAVVCSALLAACGDGGTDRAGGGEAREAPLVLTFAQANHDPPEQLVRWAEDVDRLSDGAMQIEFRNAWRAGEVDYETGTIADITAGEVDLGWVGARAFDTVGVMSFQALLAPMLVDSHELQAAVFDAGIPEQMLAGVEALDAVGIGVLPGPMRKLLGKADPYLTPENFRGDAIGLQASAVAEQTFTALGATTVRLPSGAQIGAVDGYEQQLASIAGNNYAVEAEFVTANLNLWPRPLVIVAGADAYESLDDEQQAILREASRNAIAPALDESREEDASGGASVCAAGMSLVTASAADLDALRAALEPVYATLAADAETASFLDAIVELKDATAAPPDTYACETSPTETTPP